jgi:hypothetical protein
MNAFAAIAGIGFGAGVCVSGMVRPSKVLGFLDFGDAWDASLLVVMGVAMAISVVAWRVVARLKAPRIGGGAFPGPPSKVIDVKLIGGAALFGVGWGLAGFCPGPAIVSVVAGTRASLVFVGALVLAMFAYDRITRSNVTNE